MASFESISSGSTTGNWHNQKLARPKFALIRRATRNHPTLIKEIANATHLQRRDALVQLVFDIFYQARYKRKAEKLQRSMKALLVEYSSGKDIRMVWGSFEDEGTHGAQLDMSRVETQKLFYDSVSAYKRLQKIQKCTDPNDLFHTSFTVQKP